MRFMRPAVVCRTAICVRGCPRERERGGRPSGQRRVPKGRATKGAHISRRGARRIGGLVSSGIFN
eukprot:6854955-Prymnesium_polylepis.1